MPNPIIYTGTFKVLRKIVDWINALGGFSPEEYDSSVARHGPYAYITGDYCKYQGTIYRYSGRYSVYANAQNPPPFDQADWTEFIDLFDELAKKPGLRTYTQSNGAIGEIFNSAINVASGSHSHAEGLNTTASGSSGSHAEGMDSKAIGSGSHAEGYASIAYSSYSHVEGSNTVAGADGYPYAASASHAEGYGSKAVGDYCHAEGYYTTAGGGAPNFKGYSHAEGYYTQATGQYSHAEGNYAKAAANYSHAEGCYTEANGRYSHVEGQNSKTGTDGYYAHAEGCFCEANETSCHAEGYQTKANGMYSHAEGYGTITDGQYAHAEGNTSQAKGNISHAGGYYSQAIGYASFAHGYYTKANSNQEVAFGSFNDSADPRTDIPNYNTTASYTTGDQVKRYVNGKHDGNIYQANVDIASPAGEFDPDKWDIVGTYPTVMTLFSIGNGTDTTNRSNAFEIKRDGTCLVMNKKVRTEEQVPDPPTTDGTYTLQCTVSNGVPTYSWV